MNSAVLPPLIIRAYYTQAPTQMMDSPAWAGAYPQLLKRIPPARAEALQRIRHAQTRLNSSLGLLLLWYAMRQNGITGFRLQELDYSPNRKPACPGRPPFNISHSHELTLIAVTSGNDGEVGVDAEHIRQIDAGKFGDYIKQAELELAGDDEARFINCWTRKEAVIKAEGNSGVWDLPKVALHSAGASYNNRHWSLIGLSMPDGYRAHIACDRPAQTVSTDAVDAGQLVREFLRDDADTDE